MAGFKLLMKLRDYVFERSEAGGLRFWLWPPGCYAAPALNDEDDQE